jgi:6-phosphogluconolactonase
LPADKFKILSVPDTLIDDSCQAAKEFEKQLRSLDPPINEHGFPVFDLLFLGLGPDGHTCSLFPGHPLLNEDTVWISHLDNSPKPPPRRITVTMPVLNAARNVAFIANGAGKAETIRAIVAENNQHYPPSQIKRTGQQEPIQWFIDEPAASQIVGEEQKI